MRIGKHKAATLENMIAFSIDRSLGLRFAILKVVFYHKHKIKVVMFGMHVSY